MKLLVISAPRDFFYRWGGGLAPIASGPAQVSSATVVWAAGSWWFFWLPWGFPVQKPPLCIMLERSAADCAGTGAARLCDWGEDTLYQLQTYCKFIWDILENLMNFYKVIFTGVDSYKKEVKCKWDYPWEPRNFGLPLSPPLHCRHGVVPYTVLLLSSPNMCAYASSLSHSQIFYSNYKVIATEIHKSCGLIFF